MPNIEILPLQMQVSHQKTLIDTLTSTVNSLPTSAVPTVTTFIQSPFQISSVTQPVSGSLYIVNSSESNISLTLPNAVNFTTQGSLITIFNNTSQYISINMYDINIYNNIIYYGYRYDANTNFVLDSLYSVNLMWTSFGWIATNLDGFDVN